MPTIWGNTILRSDTELVRKEDEVSNRIEAEEAEKLHRVEQAHEDGIKTILSNFKITK